PNLKKNMAVSIVSTDYGLQLGEKADPSSDTVVLLGGLAMPKMEVNVNGLKKMIDEITEGHHDRQILGACIGGVFQKAGWDKLIDFDYLVDADMEVTTYGFK
ncbi:MAG: DUF2124 family protein, partial [Candidatus Methanoperedens sp.]|nr:DUF2124 family protein [Candidatus Methanoperedens sp.]